MGNRLNKKILSSFFSDDSGEPVIVAVATVMFTLSRPVVITEMVVGVGFLIGDLGFLDRLGVLVAVGALYAIGAVEEVEGCCEASYRLTKSARSEIEGFLRA